VRLHEGWRSSASWRVRWALALKRVAYQSVLVDIDRGEHHRLAPLNPMRSVPTLELDDGTVLTESVAIIEWLEETRPQPALLPSDPRERAHVRELVQIINSGIHPLQNTSVRLAISSDPDEQGAWCSRWIVRGLAAYEAHVARGGGRFSSGDRFTMADLYLAPQVRNAERFGADLSACPRVREIYAACLETPEGQATSPDEVRKRAASGPEAEPGR
jgi:maleylacetoacetate isomerase